MKVAFDRRKEEETFNDERLMLRTYGKIPAREIKKSHSALVQAKNVAFLLQNRIRGCHQLTGDLFEMFAINDDQPYRMIFRAEDPIPRKNDGGIDTSAVEAVSIVELHVDYH